MTNVPLLEEHVAQGIEITNAIVKKTKSRLTSMCNCSYGSKVQYLFERDALYTAEDLIQETMAIFFEAVKKHNLTFQSEYQVIQYAKKCFINRIKYYMRKKTYIKKSNCFTVSMDSPATATTGTMHIAAGFSTGGADNSSTTVGDLISKELKYQITEHCHDAIDLLRKNLFIKVDEHNNIEVKTFGLLGKLAPQDRIVSMNQYLYDRMNMTRKEMSDTYASKGLYLGKKLYDKINEVVDGFTQSYFAGELCLN